MGWQRFDARAGIFTLNQALTPALNAATDWDAAAGFCVIRRTVPAACFENPPAKGTVRVSFVVANAIRPSEVMPGNLERRRLGIALHELTLKPPARGA